jgi:threonine/homoserine/homoserine lactone efflux protein
MNIKLKAAGDVAGVVAVIAGTVWVAGQFTYGPIAVSLLGVAALLYVGWTIRVAQLKYQQEDREE